MSYATTKGGPAPGFERIKCEACKGLGTVKRPKGMTYRTMRDGRRRPDCQICRGFGFNETKVKPK